MRALRAAARARAPPRAAAAMTSAAAAAAGAPPPPQPQRTPGCYVGAPLALHGPPGGALAGLRVAVKDSFDVAGRATGNGSPAYAAGRPPAAAHAGAVAALLAAGAEVVGKNVMDELGYSLAGENAHYGAPPNAAAPGRTSGGSSSGTAAAVAAGDAPLGLGADTGGSVRVPASYCGLYGLRPSHGRISTEGLAALAPSFDTAGVLARDAATLRRGAQALLLPPAAPESAPPLRRWLVAADAFSLVPPETAQALYSVLSERIDAVRPALGGVLPEDVALAEESSGGLAAWAEVFRVHQAREAWGVHGAWLAAARPALGPGVAERFAAAAAVTDPGFAAAVAARAGIRARMDALLGADGFIVLPAAPGGAPRVGGGGAAGLRAQLLALTSVAGLAGLPQATVPIGAAVDGAPVGLGIIAPRGRDEALLELVGRLAAALGRD
jgi:amidase